MTKLSTLITAVPIERVQASIVEKDRAPRVYEPVWQILRARGKVVIDVAEEEFLPRIKRMISKEKDTDVGFKVMNELDKFRLQNEYNRDTKQLTITLVAKYGIVERNK